MRSDSQRLPTLLSTMMIWYFGVAACHGQANPDYQVSIGSGTVSPFNMVDLTVSLDSSGEPLAGWALGVCHDPAQLQIVMVAMGSSSEVANDGSAVDFRIVNIEPNGFQVSVLIDNSGIHTLPSGIGHELEVVTYAVLAPVGQVATLQFCDTLGQPPIANVVVQESGASVTPVQISGSLEIVPVTFVRGDIQQDGDITIGDPIALLTILFIGGTDELNCEDARDVNDDAQVDLADPISLLSYLFSSGAMPVAPFPGCGLDPTADDGLSCDVFIPCP